MNPIARAIIFILIWILFLWAVCGEPEIVRDLRKRWRARR